MKNFKKLFSIVAIAAILGMAVPTTVLGAASYSDELQGAYDYAYGNGITTQSSIDTANMYGSLTRVAMAKMMANYAIEVLGQTPDTTKECSFPDVSAALDAQYDNGVTNACQLGLMGVGITNFNPNGLVTRAEFGTVLSRALYGDVNNGGTPYYVEHLAALKDAGIMNNIDTPSQLEVRGYVMLMMQRASGATTPAICETPENVLSCSLGLDTCPAECVTNEVKAGDLSLSLASGTPASMTSIPQNGIVNFAVVDFKAQSEDIKVNSVTVTRQGLGQRADISRIYFERNGMRVSGRASLSTDNTAVISFSPALIVKKNSTETLDLVVNVAATTAGGEHAFKVTNVNSSAASASYNITTPTLRTSNYQVGKVEFDTLGSAQSVRAGESNVELGQFKLTNTSSDNKELKVKAITLRQNESADLKNLSNLAIYRDGDKVSTDVMVNGKEVTFALDNKLTDGQSSIYYIRGTVDFVDNAGEKYQFNLRNAEDLNVAEYTTMFRAAVKGPADITFVSTLLAVYTAEGADVMLSRDAALSSSIQVTPGDINTIVMKGTIKANEAISLEDLALTVTPGNPADLLSNTITKLTLKVGSATSTWTPSAAAGTQTATFDGTFTVDGTSNVIILADIKSTATNNKTFQIQTLDLTKFTVREYVSTQNTIAATSVAGNITAPLATVTASKLNVARTDGLSNRSVVIWANNVLLGKVRFTTQNAGSVRLSALTLQNIDATPANYNNKLNVTMYINGTAISTRNMTSPTLTFSSLPSSATVTTATPLDIEFRGNIDQTVTATHVLALQLNAVQATDNNSQTVTPTPPTLNFATITATAGGTVAFSTNSNTPGASLLAAGTADVELARFNVNATDDNLKLTDLYLKNAAWAALDLGQRLSNIQLLDGTWVLANGVVLDGGTSVGFENMSASNFVVTAGNAKTLSVRATINNVLNSADVAAAAWLLKLAVAQPTTPTVGTVNGARFISESNGNIVTPTAGLTISNQHRVVRGKVTIATTATTATETRLLNFSVTADGNRSEFRGLAFTLRNNAGAGTINLYKNSVSAGNLIGTVATAGAAAANAETLAITLGTPEEVAAGSTANYILEIVGYVPSQVGTTNLSRQFQLNDVTYGDMFNDATVSISSLFNYVNAGNFPLVAPSFMQ